MYPRIGGRRDRASNRRGSPRGGFRISEEQELRALRQGLAEYPEAIRAVLQASHALRRPVSDIGAHDVESWAIATGMTVEQCLQALTVHVDCCRAFLKKI